MLTDEGVRYHVRIAAALGEIYDASVELLSRNNSRHLSIWCVPGFASQWLASRLSEFQTKHPELELELRPTDSSPDFSRYEANVDIRYIAGDEPISGSQRRRRRTAVRDCAAAVVAVASPGYVALMPPIQSPADLLRAPLLHEVNARQWRNWFAAYGSCHHGPFGPSAAGTAHLNVVEAALRG